MTDLKSVFKTEFNMTPSQCRAARGLIGMEQGQLAELAKVARSTVVDFENAVRNPRGTSVDAIRRALENAGVEFIDENGGGAGVRLSKKTLS